MKILVLVFAFTVGATTCLCAQGQQDFKNYGVGQAGVTTSGNKATLAADFGEGIGNHLQIYLAGGWVEDKGLHLTSGAKVLMLPNSVRVRPYVRGGLGIISFFTPPLQDQENRFLAEGGAGVAFAVGRQGCVDIGYGYMRPHESVGFSRLYAGFGFRY
jgi:hypothetical protein